MAVYTHITPDEFSAILESYAIGEFVSADAIAEGVENSNYRLTTSEGTYIATVFERRTKAEDLPFFLGLKEHLAEHDVPCPVPVRTKNGALLQDVNGQSFAIVSFLNGKWTHTISAEHCAQVGNVLGKMHVGAEAFDGVRENEMRVQSYKEILQSINAEDVNAFGAGLYDALVEECDVLAREWPTDLPAGIIHGDVFPDNVLFDRGDKLSGLIDFYFACNDYWTLDIAITMNAWCFERQTEFNITKARALLKGYQEVRVLTDQERAYLPMLCRGAAMRFLLTRMYDWANPVEGAVVTPKNPKEYIAKWQFHTTVKSAGEYGL